MTPPCMAMSDPHDAWVASEDVRLDRSRSPGESEAGSGTDPGPPVPLHRPRIVTLAEARSAQEPLLHTLALAGAMIEEAADISAMLMRLSTDPLPDLVVFAWDMTTMSVIEALQRVRESGASPAVLVLTGSRAPAGAEEGPARYAGDVAELQTTLRHLVRAVESLAANADLRQDGQSPTGRPPEPRTSALDLRYDVSRAFWNGRRIDLSLAEFRLVGRLAGSPGVDISHRDLYDVIKGEGFVSGRGEAGFRGNVRAAIKRVRRKFQIVDASFDAIRSYHGFGYRWEEAETQGAVEPRGNAPGLPQLPGAAP